MLCVCGAALGLANMDTLTIEWQPNASKPQSKPQSASKKASNGVGKRKAGA